MGLFFFYGTPDGYTAPEGGEIAIQANTSETERETLRNGGWSRAVGEAATNLIALAGEQPPEGDDAAAEAKQAALVVAKDVHEAAQAEAHAAFGALASRVFGKRAYTLINDDDRALTLDFTTPEAAHATLTSEDLPSDVIDWLYLAPGAARELNQERIRGALPKQLRAGRS